MGIRTRRGVKFAQLASWEDGTWAGMMLSGTNSEVWLARPKDDSWACMTRVFSPSGELKFLAESHGEGCFSKMSWLLENCVPEDAAINGAPIRTWIGLWGSSPGRLATGFDPEPYVLLGELHPAWSGDRSWVRPSGET